MTQLVALLSNAEEVSVQRQQERTILGSGARTVPVSMDEETSAGRHDAGRRCDARAHSPTTKMSAGLRSDASARLVRGELSTDSTCRTSRPASG